MLNGAHKEAYGIQNHLELFASLSVTSSSASQDPTLGKMLIIPHSTHTCLRNISHSNTLTLQVPLLGGVNDYEPFTKWGLERFDPDSYAALVQIWGLDDAPVALPSKI